jgi:hypothetical protein
MFDDYELKYDCGLICSEIIEKLKEYVDIIDFKLYRIHKDKHYIKKGRFKEIYCIHCPNDKFYEGYKTIKGFNKHHLNVKHAGSIDRSWTYEIEKFTNELNTIKYIIDNIDDIVKSILNCGLPNI